MPKKAHARVLDIFERLRVVPRSFSEPKGAYALFADIQSRPSVGAGAENSVTTQKTKRKVKL